YTGVKILKNVRMNVFASCALLLPAAAARGQVPVTGAFLVNEWTTLAQHSPVVAADAAGNFVVAWDSSHQDGDQGGIFARRFLPSGVPLGITEFRVNAYTTAYQQVP